VFEYEDLRIRIEARDGDVYRVRAERPDGSGATGDFKSPLDDVGLANFVQRVGMPRQQVSRWSSNPVEEARRVGARLFAALMRDDIALAFVDARARAEARDRGLRLTLILTDAPALMRLPWEYLYERPRFLAQSRETPLVRGLDIPAVRPAEPLTLPLRILGLVSAPRDEDPLDTAAERAKLEQALQPLVARGVVDLQWVDSGTLSALELALARPEPVHVLHFIGHGGYDDLLGIGALAFEDEHRSGRPVTGEDLCALLGDQRSLRLVLLNSCEGARTSVADPFSGVATALLACRIPAVVGMQFEITDEAAITFGSRLYQSLAAGTPIDEAIVETRKAIFAAGHEAEFGTPVLYAVPGRMKLFDVSAPIAAEPAPDAPALEEDAELTLHPRLVFELAEALTPGATVVARIEVEAEEPTGRWRGSTDVIALLMTSQQLRVQGSDRHPLRLAAGAPAQVHVEFRVDEDADERDPLLVTLFVVHKGRPAASVHRTLMLEPPEAALPAPVLRADLRAVAPDLTIQVVDTGDGWTCSVTSPLLEELAVPAVADWKLAGPIGQIVDRMLSEVTAPDASPDQRRAALVGAGHELFRATPPPFQDAIWRLVDAGAPLRSIFVVTDEPNFPWELVVPHRAGERRHPLGAEFAVGRWYRADATSPPQRLPLVHPLVIAPSGHGLAAADAEADFVIATMGGRRLSPATVASLDAALTASPAGLIHYAGLGDRSEGSATIYLDAGERLIDIQLAGLPGLAAAISRDRPLVFLNASEIAGGGAAVAGGLVGSLLDLGASAVIAPAWSVSDDIAYAVAREFYAALTADPQRPFADILRELRRRAYEGDEPEDSWAAYTFFGDPLAARAA
jgi:CHAT domain-containing protein